MRVLVLCEESGRVRRAFRGYGHDAWSLDILPAQDKSPFHIQCDARILRSWDFDLVIAHPPCTHLAGSGARWLTDHWVTKKSLPEGRYWHDGSEKRRLQAESVEFVDWIWNLPVPRIAIENPVGMLPKLWRDWDQMIHPWQHGHGEQKQTCLWLKNLPPIMPTDEVKGREQRIWAMTPGPERERLRSLTYLGIAEAFASQWGRLPTVAQPAASEYEYFLKDNDFIPKVSASACFPQPGSAQHE